MTKKRREDANPPPPGIMEKLPFGNKDFLSMDELLNITDELLNITGHFPEMGHLISIHLQGFGSNLRGSGESGFGIG